MFKFSIVQGRLASKVGTNYQYFPVHAWQDEFFAAKEIGFDGLEWIVSDLSNPLFNRASLQAVKDLSDQTGIAVFSLSLDLLMRAPVHCMEQKNLFWIFDNLLPAISILGIERISIPVEETSAVTTQTQVRELIAVLIILMGLYHDKIPKICLETDLSPVNLTALLNTKGLERLGILLDVGNVIANGYGLQDYLKDLNHKIYGVHLKDRACLFSPNCKYGEGDVNFTQLFNSLDACEHLSHITLQSYRGDTNYLEDARTALTFAQEMAHDACK